MRGMRLEIIYLETGELRVNGNLENKVMCLGMLEMANELVRNFSPEKESGIVLAQDVVGNGGIVR